MATPLSKAEIKEAFLQLNRQTSPRPNGFGPAYYQKVLSLLKPIILPTLELLSLAGQTKCLNQAHVVLAKKDSAGMPDSYRPISLQHRRIKADTKVLTTRLKPLIPSSVLWSSLTKFPFKEECQNNVTLGSISYPLVKPQ